MAGSPPHHLPLLIAKKHPRFSDLEMCLDLPLRKDDDHPGITTAWVTSKHPLVPKVQQEHGRHIVLVWPLTQEYLSQVLERTFREGSVQSVDDCLRLGKSYFACWSILLQLHSKM